MVVDLPQGLAFPAFLFVEFKQFFLLRGSFELFAGLVQLADLLIPIFKLLPLLPNDRLLSQRLPRPFILNSPDLSPKFLVLAPPLIQIIIVIGRLRTDHVLHVQRGRFYLNLSLVDTFPSFSELFEFLEESAVEQFVLCAMGRYLFDEGWNVED